MYFQIIPNDSHNSERIPADLPELWPLSPPGEASFQSCLSHPGSLGCQTHFLSFLFLNEALKNSLVASGAGNSQGSLLILGVFKGEGGSGAVSGSPWGPISTPMTMAQGQVTNVLQFAPQSQFSSWFGSWEALGESLETHGHGIVQWDLWRMS